MFAPLSSTLRTVASMSTRIRATMTYALACIIVFAVTDASLAATMIASLTTDQSEYLYGDTVHFYGTGFSPNETVTIEVRDELGNLSEQWSINASTNGSFSTTWTRGEDYFQRENIEALAAGDPSGLEATTMFSLAPPAVSLQQMRNGSAASPDSPINWVNGNAGASNSHLLEKWSQAYRAVFTDMTVGDTVEFVVGYDITHSGKHAIDYLTYYDRINDPTHNSLYGHSQETIDPLAGLGVIPGPVYAAIPPPPLSSCSLVVPNPPGPPQLQPCTSFDNLDNDPTQVRMTLYGGSFLGATPVTYDNAGDPTQTQSEARVRIKFVPSGSTSVLLWGGHLASNGDWGAGNSAGGISGSPYHNRAIELRINGDVKNVGNQDRSLSADAVAPCEIILSCPPDTTISCDDSTDPSNTGTASFSANNECGTVNLTYVDSTSGSCPSFIYRKWIATGSGGADSCVQVITLVDTTKPVLSGCPANTSASIGAIPPPASVTASDNCSVSLTPVFTETFNPNGCGGYTGVITRKWVATDVCGNKDSCMQTITVIDNTPPTCNIPTGPFTYFQCAPASVSIPVSATDNGDPSVTCAVLSGPGTVSGGNWTYTPSGDEVVNVTIRCTDDCGNFCDGSFSVTFIINDAPACAPISDTVYTQCTPTQVCRPYSSTDPNGNFESCSIISGPGTLSGGNWCYTPSDDGVVNVTIRCEDSCGAFCDESFSVTFQINDPPVIDLGDDISLAQTIPQDTICFTYSVADPEGLSGLLEALVSGPAGTTIDTANNEICFVPPGTGTFAIVASVTDSCGLTDYDTINVIIAATQPPNCMLPGDTSILQCTPAQICLPVSATSLHGPVTCSVTSGPGVVSGGAWCYTPGADEVVNVTITCTDTLGVSCTGSFTVNVDINDPPACPSLSDTTYFQCVPTEVCRPFVGSDINGNLTGCSIISGPGSLSGGNWCYTPSGDETVNVTIECVDACGATCQESFSVTFVINDPPVCASVSDTTYFQCTPMQVCRAFSSTDPNGNLAACSVVAGPGTISNGNWCYTPSGDETVNVTIRCTDACGATCEESFSVTFIINDPPVCASVADTTYFLCAPTQVCRAFSGSDANGNLSGCSIINGPGTLSGGFWCYTPAGDETVNVTIRCSDACGAFCEETFSVTFVINDGPVCATVSDTTYFQCVPSEVCRPFSASDPNGNLSGCSIINGPGTLSGGNWCYTPSGDETVNVTIRCQDACGAFCDETFSVTFEINDAPLCGTLSDTTYFQCAPAEVCRPFAGSDINSNLIGCSIISGPGSLSGGNWCYTPSGDEVVNVTIRCEDACGAVCEESFSVTFVINDPPVCSPVEDTSVFQCVASQFCLPFTSNDPNGNLTGCTIISGPGTLSGGNWCYTPSGDETVNVTIRCEDACGAFCEESFTVEFDVNETPVCSSIDDATVFQCAPAEVCYPFTSSDGDGNLIGCTIISGPGTLSGGNWCYTPAGNEVANVTIRCEDACGAICEESFSITFMIGMPPQITCPPNASFDCAGQVPACSPSDVTVVGGSGQVVVSCSTSTNGGSGCPGNSLVYTYYYTATDSCGLQSQCNRTITVIDSVGPVLSGCPADTTISCNSPLPPPANVTGSDNCDASVTVQLTETQDLSGCGGNTGTVTRVWTATDACGNISSCTQTITVQDSQAPVCNIPSGPFSYFQCTPAMINVPVSATDNCDANVTCAVISGPGAVVGGNWQYMPAGDAAFSVTIRCTDDCGNSCEGTFAVNVSLNDPPSIAFGADQSVFQCMPAPICVSYTVSDANGLGGTVESLVSGPAGASLNAAANQVCFTPPSSGLYTIIVQIVDSCGASDQDTINVNVTINSPPTIAFGPDIAVFQCVSSSICVGYTASDPNGNALTETLLSGPAGAVLNQAADQVCFTPASSGNYTIIVRVQDTCSNADVDTINVTVTLNLPPLAIGPNDTSVTQCSPTQICLPVGGVDPEGKPLTITKVSGPGTVAGGQWCYTPIGDEVANVTIRVTDSCGVFDEESFVVAIDVNSPPVCQVPNDSTIIVACSLRTITLPVSAFDPEGDPVQCLVINGPGSIDNGVWSFTPPADGQYCVTIQCIDECGVTCQEQFCINVMVTDEDCDCLFKVSINEGTPIPALNGQIVDVPVKFDLTGVAIGGFDLLLCYDATAITLVDVEKGLAIEKWEYFTYRLGANGNCSGGNCPDGIVRLVGITDLNNGIPVVDPNAFLPVGTVANLSFVITSDRNFINQCIPIQFCWFDCTDNTIASKSGDTTFLEITFNYEPCQSNPKGDPIPAICFEDGSICIQEPPDDRGDINLNGIANEVGDAVLFTNYFVYGPIVWDPVWDEVQILATDINDDGIVLTVADLIYLIRIITGDEQPFPPGTGTGSPKLAPYANSATATVQIETNTATLYTTSMVDVGGALYVFRYNAVSVGEPRLLEGCEDMALRYHADGSELRVLIYRGWDSEGASIPAGTNDVFAVPLTGEGTFELVDAQFSDARGALLTSGIAKSTVPADYALHQNYPNPFNAGTVIGFDLKDATEWNVAIYNVLGQVVRTYEGTSSASNVRVAWDGRDREGSEVASGVYFYRVTTTKWNAIKKMTLIR